MSDGPRPPRPRRAALALTASAAVLAGAALAGPATASSTGPEPWPPPTLPLAAGRWAPVPGLAEARDVNNRGDVLGIHVDGNLTVWSPRDGHRRVEVPGYPHVDGIELTDDGRVVGSVSTLGREERRAFVWHPDGSAAVMPAAPGTSGAALGATRRGDLVGYVSAPGGAFFTTVRAVRWTPDGVAHDLGGPAGATLATTANARGVAAGYHIDESGGPMHAVRWTARDGYTGLDGLGAGNTTATGVNARGTVVGTSQAPDGTDHVVLWRAGTTTPTDLGRVGDGSTAPSLSTAAVAGAYVTGSPGVRRAYRWTPCGGFEDLGHPDGSGGDQDAVAVNDRGVIAVTVSGAGSSRAHLWRPDGGRRCT